MKKLIFLITLLMAFFVNAQDKEPRGYPLIMGQYANLGGGGNLFDSGNNVLIDVNNVGLFVLGGKTTLTQTGAVVQNILDGIYIVDMALSNATPELILHDTDASAGSSDVVIEADGEPSISLHASDGDEVNISISTGDKMTFNNADGYIFGDHIQLPALGRIFQSASSRPHIEFTSNTVLNLRTSEVVSDSYIALDINPVAGAGVDGEVRFGDTGTSGEYTKVDSLGQIITPLGINFAADAQGDDDYEISLDGITALNTGMMVVFTANTVNTDGATLEIGEVGDLDAILKLHDQALASGDIEAGQVVVVVFDGTNWQMISQLAQ